MREFSKFYFDHQRNKFRQREIVKVHIKKCSHQERFTSKTFTSRQTLQNLGHDPVVTQRLDDFEAIIDLSPVNIESLPKTMKN